VSGERKEKATSSYYMKGTFDGEGGLSLRGVPSASGGGRTQKHRRTGPSNGYELKMIAIAVALAEGRKGPLLLSKNGPCRRKGGGKKSVARAPVSKKKALFTEKWDILLTGKKGPSACGEKRSSPCNGRKKILKKRSKSFRETPTRLQGKGARMAPLGSKEELPEGKCWRKKKTANKNCQVKERGASAGRGRRLFHTTAGAILRGVGPAEMEEQKKKKKKKKKKKTKKKSCIKASIRPDWKYVHLRSWAGGRRGRSFLGHY